ncbi:saccharopine dehydrogenase [Nitzschia inconspicua]|uniref:Saccharopine dehydrogenase n=1 Tax=Nitzschia inconspicua TaxID=303405 RepID=A0A9K3KNI2_9STRA|nr:saccharopine dehydrogenase [Nitzschia inconspicua]
MQILWRLIVVLLSLVGGRAFQSTLKAIPGRKPNKRRSSARSRRENGTFSASEIGFDSLKDKKILVVGGSGRVGGSVATQLVKRGAAVTVGGTQRQNYETSRQRWQTLFDDHSSEIAKIKFVSIDRESAASVTKVLESQDFDLVVHTAGPFQGKVGTPNGVIEGCIAKAVPYVDVCDDYCTALAAKSKFMDKAKNQGVSCIISTGCWPGVSSLMASLLIRRVLQADKTLEPKDLNVDFSFFTAGSGGAGATLLVATFLILAERALTIRNGRRTPVGAMKEYSTVNFGNVVGKKPVAHLNLLETASIHEVFGVGNVQALFGTSPGFWNTLLGLMAQLPSSLLANEDIMTKLAVFSLPIVRVVDIFAGATNAMRCDVTSTKSPELKASAIYAHENLEPCVGECVVAFCAAVLSGKVPPGVNFPEEALANEDDVVAVLSLASIGAHTISTEATGVDLSSEDIWGPITPKVTVLSS